MSTSLSVAQVLAQLEAKVALHREKLAFHEQQEELHRGQKALHADELSKAVERFEAFRAASADVGEVLAVGEIAPPPEPAPAHAEELDLASMASLTPLIARIVESKGPEETFGSSTVTGELHQRWGAKLGRPVSSRTVSATLRRWASSGRLKVVQEGWPYREALYRKR